MALASPPPHPVPATTVVCPGAPVGAPMSRCECAGVTFSEVASRIEAEGLTPEQVICGTGCAQTCGACLPDLLRFLAAR